MKNPNNPKKTHKTQKTQLGWGLFLKTRVLSNPEQKHFLQFFFEEYP